MRTISSARITEAVTKLCIYANEELGDDVYCALKKAVIDEKSEIGRETLKQIIENADIAWEERVPICQDTGMAVFFIEIGKEVFIEGENITDAVNHGVKSGYEEGCLRMSVVSDPLTRKNTGNNTPAIIYYDIVDGESIKIDFTPKGFGSENMSALKMLKPSDGIDGVKRFVIQTVRDAGANPCPPLVVGVGIGGTMDKAAVLSKKALLRELGTKSDSEHIRMLEEELTDEINRLGIGPSGLGGTVTALGVNILTYPTHIAGLPVAVNICCHASRHKSVII